MKRALIILAILVALPYARTPVYRFPTPVMFSGTHLLNPYEGIKGVWQRANLHAHGRAWSGLTNGQQSDEEVVQAYRNLGYSVAGISDYHHIAVLQGVPMIPIYEHGYNIAKRHQLAIGADHVEWFDFPLWQSPSHEQFILDLVRKKATLVAIAHPSGRDAYSVDNLQQLTGYQLIEVVNGPFAVEEPWDAALSSGHPVWGLANDDSHDINDPRRMAAAWNMIDAPTASTDDVIGALRAGRFYAVLRTDDSTGPRSTTFTSVEVNDRTVTVTCAGEPANFVFVGQNGDVRKTARATLSAAYTFDDDDTYIRTVIRSPQGVMYLNPVFRYDGTHVPAPSASLDVAATWLVRSSLIFAGMALVAISRKRRTLGEASAAQPVMPGADQKPA